jgi:hypothetical protein
LKFLNLKQKITMDLNDSSKAQRDQYRIPLSEAVRRTTNWREFIRTQEATASYADITRGVFISIEDIQGLASIKNPDGVSGVRAYFALDQSPEQQLPGTGSVRLILVAVDNNNRDILGNTTPIGLGETEDEIYDFTKPCPDNCDPRSPLYGDAP